MAGGADSCMINQTSRKRADPFLLALRAIRGGSGGWEGGLPLPGGGGHIDTGQGLGGAVGLCREKDRERGLKDS